MLPYKALEGNDLTKTYHSPYRYLMCIPCFLALIADLAALLSIFLGQLWRGNAQNLLIASMCFSSLLFSITFSATEIFLWDMLMKEQYAILILLILGGKYTYTVFSISLLSLTVEQHLTIKYPLTHPSKVTPLRMTGITAGVWIFSLTDTIGCILLLDFDQSSQYHIPVWYTLVSFIVFLLVPCIVSTILQIFNLHTAKKHMARINAQVAHETLSINMKEQLRKVITNVSVLIIFSLSWMSIQVMLLVSLVAPSNEEGSHIHVCHVQLQSLCTVCFLFVCPTDLCYQNERHIWGDEALVQESHELKTIP